jgi:hypothetical protein
MIDKIAAEAYDQTGRKTLAGHGKAAIESVIGFVEKANTTVEHGIRLATFSALRDSGVPIDQAAQAALNITVNFSKGGEKRTLMNAMYLFYNASLQGNMVILNGLMRSPAVRKAVLAVVAAGALQDALMSSISAEDQDRRKFYDKIPEWKKNSNFIVMTGDKSYIAFPMPWGLNFFHSLGRNMVRGMRTGDVGDSAYSVGSAFAGAFNPLGGTESVLNFLAPTILDPLVDIYRNRDWRDKPIVPEQLPWGTKKPQSQLYWAGTSDNFKGIAEALNELAGGSKFISSGSLTDVSPAHMQYWYDFSLGSAGAFVLRSTDLFTSVIPGWFNGEEFDWNDIPFARRVMGVHTSQNDLERFFAMTQSVFAIEADMKDARERGDAARAQALMQNYGNELMIAPQVRRLAAMRSRLADEMRQINESTLPDSYKQAMKKMLRQRRDDAVLDANKLYREYVEGVR